MAHSVLKDREHPLGPYVLAITALHVLALVFLSMSALRSPVMWGIGMIAYSLGLRHAFDADHIAAIDITIRKLVQQKRNALGVGMYFSLGHSTVVLLMGLATAFSVQWARTRLPLFQEVGGRIGTSVSGVYLIAIGVVNLIILYSLFKSMKKVRAGKADKEDLEKRLPWNGLVSRLTRPLFRFVGRSWHVYPIGFLFGLGFDTASEITLLSLSGSVAWGNMPIFGIIAFPLLFAAAMSLMDTANGVLMTKIYRWSHSNPRWKLYYDVAITAATVLVSLFIGSTELVRLVK